MYSRILTRLDKNLNTVLCHLFYQSRQLKNLKPKTKRRSQSIHTFAAILNNILHYNPDSDLHKILYEHAVGNLVAIRTIMNILQINREDAKLIVKKNKTFNLATRKTMTDNYQILKMAGMSEATLKNNPNILVEDTKTLQKKVAITQKLVDINFSVTLLIHSTNSLDLFVRSESKVACDDSIKDRVKSYGKYWKVQDKDLYSIISKYMYQMVYHRENSVEMIKLLLDNNVSVKSLLKKKWNLQMDIEEAKQRLEKYSQLGLLSPIEPHILNCSTLEFNKKLKIQTCKLKNVKAYPRIITYLCKKSGYSIEIVKWKIYTISKHSYPNFNDIVRKTKLIIKEGYAWHDIIWSIKVLSLPKNLIISRFAQLKNINHRPPCLNVLSLSKKAFVKYVNKYSSLQR